ncbi:MAG: helix-turn-helix transcriptional regulator [Candidatus Scalindua sp.]|jgi:putative transcriptional regulator|nr:helix-turn-helix transcriptional regulator [Candidatus Scalindua sp.]
MKKPLGELIEIHRLKKGLTQEEVGIKLGVSRQTINHAAHDKHEPKFKLALRIADFLGIKRDDIEV